MTHKVPSLLDVPVHQRERMDGETSELYLKLVMMDFQASKQFEESDAEEMGDIGRILYKRLKYYGVSCTLAAGICACVLCKGSPGNLVMYAHSFAKLYTRFGRPVNMSDISQAFPMGFPSDKALTEYWDKQKGVNFGEEVDNMLDFVDILDFSE